MKSKLLNDGPEKTYVLVFGKGDEVMAHLKAFGRQHIPRAAHFTAIGAFATAKLGYFDPHAKNYKHIGVDEQAEVLSLVGDFAPDLDNPGLHAHVVLGLPDGTTRGGHLIEAVVWPTLELVITEEPGYMRRRKDPETGLSLIDLDA
jgi:uncharacterized protein